MELNRNDIPAHSEAIHADAIHSDAAHADAIHSDLAHADVIHHSGPASHFGPAQHSDPAHHSSPADHSDPAHHSSPTQNHDPAQHHDAQRPDLDRHPDDTPDRPARKLRVVGPDFIPAPRPGPERAPTEERPIDEPPPLSDYVRGYLTAAFNARRKSAGRGRAPRGPCDPAAR
ncbi:hypothetical protein GCM10010470_60300 [Saccharopolyspora taberi]|uniref:Uncharacterized protein n=1 Tax=Saccharopolyspora taberi TaxID=60895 RepID=A0ABN3VMC1_9PSEU